MSIQRAILEVSFVHRVIYVHGLMFSLSYIGQLVAAALLDRNVKLRLLLRDPEKATTLFGEQDEDLLQVTWPVFVMEDHGTNAYGFILYFTQLNIAYRRGLESF